MSYQKYHQEDQPTSPPAFKAFAHRKFLEGFDMVILAHSHFPEKVEEGIDGKRCLYYNVGLQQLDATFKEIVFYAFHPSNGRASEYVGTHTADF